MDFYVIPPVSSPELMHKGDRYFCLAQQYMKDPEYAQFFHNLPDDAWVTLDNGAGDHELVSEHELLNVMKELMPNEVIPPDVLFDGKITVANCMIFHEKMKLAGLDDKIEIFFCPQGKDVDEWIECYTWALSQDYIKTIGLSKIAIPNAWFGLTGDVAIMESRHNCFNYLKVNGLLHKPLHLLGMGDPREFAYYQQFEEGTFIRSSDSCNSIWSAMNSKDWQYGDFERIPTPKDYFERIVPDNEWVATAIDHNIEYLNKGVVL